MRRTSYLFLFLLVSFLLGCNSDLKLTQISRASGSEFNLLAIEVHDSKIYATGGNLWSKSEIVHSDDGKTWIVDSLCDKSIFDLYSVDGEFYAAGVDGYILSGEDFQNNRIKNWGFIRSMVKTDDGFICVGGKDWNKGYIYRLDEAFKTDSTYFFDHELSSVSISNNGNIIACGYGIILISKDKGQNWIRIENEGDNYTSIAFNKTGTGYIVGKSGTILFTEEDGEKWSFIHDGHSPFDNRSFNVIKFNEKGDGFILGDSGMIMQSNDGGNTWNRIDAGIKDDLYDFVFFDDKIYASSKEGLVYEIEL